jgi:hypothetical protein
MKIRWSQRLVVAKHRYVAFTALACAWAVTGCVNVSTLQTARTLPPGDQQVAVGGGMATFPELTNQGEVAALFDTMYFGEVDWRIGLYDFLDAGVHVTFPGTSGGDVKYQFLDEGGLAMATGLSLGAIQISSTTSSEDTTNGATDESGTSVTTETSDPKLTIIDVILPLYVSFHVDEALALYASPKYLLRAFIGDSTAVAHYAGGTLGVQLGDSVGLMAEASYLKGLSDSATDTLQYNVAFFWSR